VFSGAVLSLTAVPTLAFVLCWTAIVYHVFLGSDTSMVSAVLMVGDAYG